MSVAKIVEIVGSSNKGWEDAAQNAVNEAMKTIREIHGIEIKDNDRNYRSNYRKNHSIPGRR